MQTIDTKTLKQKLENEDVTLINVLDRDHFEDKHIPGSDNIPHSDAVFTQRVADLAGSKEQEVIVYCANKECDASPNAAEKLEQAGFENVIDFEGGTKAWEDAGFDLEGKACSTC